MGDDKNVTIKNLYLFISVETQLMFNQATQNNYKISFNEYFTERRVKSDFFSSTRYRFCSTSQ